MSHRKQKPGMTRFSLFCFSDVKPEGDAVVSVFNTGKPIADNDLLQIWNSFYRADKAHSRAEGRFGLGLSIVSSAQEAQGMQYGVENRENGVAFWFDVRETK